MYKTLIPLLLALPCLTVAGAEGPPAPESSTAPLFHEDFESGLDRWEMTDPKVWKVVEDEGDHALSLTDSSDYEPPVRSPKSMARVKDLKTGSFRTEFHAKQTGREYGHRDLCFFFGYQDPAHFYYVHLATQADEHANSIFLVNGAARVSIATTRTEGTRWDKGYHKVQITRDIETGRIEVFFDDLKTPVMVAEDKTFLEGAIGAGSFDDVGIFDDITVWPLSPSDQADSKNAAEAKP